MKRKHLCDTCIHNGGTHRPTYTTPSGKEYRIAVDYVHCRKRWTRPKVEAWRGCFDYERRKR